jgi:hypothetical protein
LYLRVREELRLRSFGKGMLKGVSGPERGELTGSWTKLQNAGIHNFDSSPNIMTMIELRRLIRAGHVARMREKKNAYHCCGVKARRMETTREE